MTYYAYAVIPTFWPPIYKGSISTGAAVEVLTFPTHSKAFAHLCTFPVGWKVAMVAAIQEFDFELEMWLAASFLSAADDECWLPDS